MPDEGSIAETAALSEPEKPRRSFRRRLLVTLGAALAVVFLVFGALSWLAYYGWLNYQARLQIKLEAEEIASLLVDFLARQG